MGALAATFGADGPGRAVRAGRAGPPHRWGGELVRAAGSRRTVSLAVEADRHRRAVDLPRLVARLAGRRTRVGVDADRAARARLRRGDHAGGAPGGRSAALAAAFAPNVLIETPIAFWLRGSRW